MSTPYTVVLGDNLTKIAIRNGLRSWRVLYYHPDNAGFRRLRPNPNLIYPGDVIQIPDKSAPSLSNPSLQPGPVDPEELDRCCLLVYKDRECSYTKSKSEYTCPEGYTKFCWMCCEGSTKIGCGECIKQADSPTSCWDASKDNTSCSIWWICAADCTWCSDHC